MVTQRIEFSGAELATFEFGRESYTYVTNAEFAGIAASEMTPVAAPIAYATFVSAAAGAFVAAANGVSNTRAIGAASALVDIRAIEIRFSAFSAPGIASEEFLPGLIVPASFSGAGSSAAVFAALTGPGYDVACRSTVTFYAMADANTRTTAAGEGVVVFVGSPIANAAVSGAASSTADMTANAVANTQLDAAGLVVVDFGAYRSLLSAFSVTAGASVVPRAQSRANSTAQAVGVTAVNALTSAFIRKYAVVNSTAHAAVSFVPDPRTYITSAFDVAGVAAIDPRAQGVYSARMESYGEAQVMWVLGRQVLLTMPFAYQVVERPQENREVERPFELRAAEWN